MFTMDQETLLECFSINHKVVSEQQTQKMA